MVVMTQLIVFWHLLHGVPVCPSPTLRTLVVVVVDILQPRRRRCFPASSSFSTPIPLYLSYPFSSLPSHLAYAPPRVDTYPLPPPRPSSASNRSPPALVGPCHSQARLQTTRLVLRIDIHTDSHFLSRPPAGRCPSPATTFLSGWRFRTSDSTTTSQGSSFDTPWSSAGVSCIQQLAGLSRRHKKPSESALPAPESVS